MQSSDISSPQKQTRMQAGFDSTCNVQIALAKTYAQCSHEFLENLEHRQIDLTKESEDCAVVSWNESKVEFVTNLEVVIILSQLSQTPSYCQSILVV